MRDYAQYHIWGAAEGAGFLDCIAGYSDFFFHFLLSQHNHKSKKNLFKNQTAVLDLPVKKEQKQDCTHVDHNQLEPFTI